MFPLGQAHVENVTDIPRSEDLFDLGQTEHVSLFDSLGQPWEVLPRISGYLRDTLEPRQLGQAHSQAVIEGDVFIGISTSGVTRPRSSGNPIPPMPNRAVTAIGRSMPKCVASPMC